MSQSMEKDLLFSVTRSMALGTQSHAQYSLMGPSQPQTSKDLKGKGSDSDDDDDSSDDDSGEADDERYNIRVNYNT